MVDQRPGGLGLPGHVSRAAPAKNYARLFKSTSSARTFGGNRTGAPGLDFETWDPPGKVRFGPQNVTPGKPHP
jgi:hypothetical protein